MSLVFIRSNISDVIHFYFTVVSPEWNPSQNWQFGHVGFCDPEM
jgi:hypothetical protein